MTGRQSQHPRSMRHPGNLAGFHQLLICVAAFAVVMLAGWQHYLQPDLQRLQAREQEERTLKSTYEAKISAAASLPLLQSRLQQAAETLQIQLRQLAAPGDRGSLLQDIAAAAQAHHLLFESARPGKTDTLADYSVYAAGLRLSGNYHDLGRFAAAVAAMQHIIVLSDLQLSKADHNSVVMEAIVLSYHRHATDSDAGQVRATTARDLP